MRIDVMSVMRGVDPFPALWKRRTSVILPGGETISVLSLPDLVQAKKTQRDKDWLMLRRLVEADYAGRRRAATGKQIAFWLSECRTPSILFELAARHPVLAHRLAGRRPALRFALCRHEPDLVGALSAEEQRERELDRAYWQPLRQELEAIRMRRPRERG